MRDPIPPGHGEPEPTNLSNGFGRGSNTYTDEDWEAFGRWMDDGGVELQPAREEIAA